MVVQFTGKHIAILGPRESGKTTLYDFLDTGTVLTSEPREQTIALVSRQRVYRREFKLALHKGYDMPGSDAYYADWHRGFEGADIVFYLFDVYRLRTEPAYAERVRQDGLEMSRWDRSGRRFHILGTHVDFDPIASTMSRAEYIDSILALDVIEALRSRTGSGPIAIGELQSDAGATELLRAVLR